jgi:hypothetical protein
LRGNSKLLAFHLDWYRGTSCLHLESSFTEMKRKSIDLQFGKNASSVWVCGMAHLPGYIYEAGIRVRCFHDSWLFSNQALKNSLNSIFFLRVAVLSLNIVKRYFLFVMCTFAKLNCSLQRSLSPCSQGTDRSPSNHWSLLKKKKSNVFQGLK